MTININGRTPEEIKRGLECCSISKVYCSLECPYVSKCHLDGEPRAFVKDALALIQQLESSLVEARKDIDMLGEQATALVGAYDAMKNERDAAVEYLAVARYCMTCIYNNVLKCDKCKGCFMTTTRPNWQWRGVQEGNYEQTLERRRE